MSEMIDYFARLEDRLKLEQRALLTELGCYRREYIHRRWVSHNSYLMNIRVPFLDVDEDVEVEIDEAAGVYRYPSPMQRSRIVAQPLSEVMLYAFRVEHWLDDLSDLIGLERSRRARQREKVPGHLWHLGDARIRGTHTFAPLFVGRLLQRAPGEALTAALVDPIHASGGVVLVTRIRSVALPNGHQQRALESLVREQEGCNVFDADALDRVLQGFRSDRGMLEPKQFLQGNRLKLPHFRESRELAAERAKIVRVMWGSDGYAPPVLSWADVNVRANTGYQSFDDAFGGSKARAEVIEKLTRARYRLRRNASLIPSDGSLRLERGQNHKSVR